MKYARPQVLPVFWVCLQVDAIWGTTCKNNKFLNPDGTCQLPKSIWCGGRSIESSHTTYDFAVSWPLEIFSLNTLWKSGLASQACNVDSGSLYKFKMLPILQGQDICPDGYWQLPVSGGVGNSCPLCLVLSCDQGNNTQWHQRKNSTLKIKLQRRLSVDQVELQLKQDAVELWIVLWFFSWPGACARLVPLSP